MQHALSKRLSQMTIRDRLNATFVSQAILGLLIILGIVAVGFSERSTVQKMDESRNNQDLANHIEGGLLEARSQEKDFLLRYENEGYENAIAAYVTPYNARIQAISEDIRTLQTSVQVAGDPTMRAATRDLLTNLEAYDSAFTRLVNTDIPKREGSYAAIIDALNELDDLVEAKANFNLTEPVDEFEILFLRYQDGTAPGHATLTEFTAYQAANTESVWQAIEEMDEAFTDNPIALSGTEFEQAMGYVNIIRTSFGSMTSDDLQIAQDVDAYTARADAIEPLVVQIVTRTDNTLHDAEASYETFEQISFVLTLIGIFVAGLMGALAMFGMYRSMKVPLDRLTASASAISQGDYHSRVQLDMQDEFSALGDAFNKMAQAVEEHQTNLGNALRSVREASRLKDEFLAVMSHELRTPLNAIIGFQGILAMSKNLDSRELHRVERTRANAERLLELINAILDISRIESGRLQLAPTAVNIRDLMTNLKERMGVLAEGKGLTLAVEVERSVPDTLWVDEDAVLKIATNLIGNAVKFTQEGQIGIHVSATREEWSLEVKDTGVGIPAHMHEIIFERFRQVDGSSTREYGGAGLGLAIVQQLAKAMGGTVRVESMPNAGSVFTVTLPIERQPTSPQPVKVMGEIVYE